jgi:glycosyltransferase involved in cell wall biosynthesis
MTPVPGSLNLDSIPYRHEDDPGPAAAEVLYVGTLIRQRRLDFLVRMFAQVLTKVPNAKLVFVGKAEMPEDQELLDNEIDRLGIPVDRICFIGEVQMSEVWRYVESASVCLSPYYPSFELDSTSPTKLIEYMAMSRPVVANEHPEQSVVIADSGAGLCVPWDETAFAEAVVTLLGDPDKAEEMSRRGRAWVERHRTNEIMAELVEGQYRRLLGKPGDSNEARSRGLGAGQTD